MAQQYRIYRHTEVINAGNLSQAQHIVTLGQGSGRHITEEWRNNGFYNTVQTRFVINDLGTELPIGTGLAVWTTQPGEAGGAFYAITRVQDGQEILDLQPGVNTLQNAVSEAVAEPCPVKVWQSADGLSAVFTQFVDIKNWNITYEGFAYNYAVMKPAGYDPAVSYPLCFDLHCWGCRYNPTLAGGSPFGLPVILVYPDDAGKTWWFGFSKTHQYRAQWPDSNWFLPTDPAMSGPIVNYTEQRVLKIIDDLEQVGGYNYDKNKVYFWGNSMGGTGVLTLASRYPEIIAAGYGSLPVTNFEVSHWNYDCAIMWGPTWLDLPVEIGGKHAAHLQKYANQSVWDWQNTQKQMRDRQADEMAFICTAHGDADNYVEWWNQGEPWYTQMQDSMRRGGSGWTQNMGGHDWMGFKGTNLNWGWLPNTGDQWKFKKNESFPAFTRFSGNSWTNHNLNIQYAAPSNGSFPGTITDTQEEWSILLKLADHPGFASTFNKILDSAWVDVTPRRLQNFVVESGKNYRWIWSDEATGAVLSEGIFAPDGFKLLTVPQVLVKNTPRRLRIVHDGILPPICAAPTDFSATGMTDTTALLSWTEVPGAVGYLISVVFPGGQGTVNVFAESHPILMQYLIPCSDFTGSIQAICDGSVISPASATISFSTTCTPPPPCASPTGLSVSNQTDTTAQISWSPVSGAQGYLVSFVKTGFPDTAFVFETNFSTTITGLLPCTNYQVAVQTFCANNELSAASFSIPLMTNCPPQPCDAPTGLAAVMVDDSTAQFSWQSAGGGTNLGFLVAYQIVGSTDTAQFFSGNNSTLVSNLAPCTVYQFSVQNICAPGSVSAASSSPVFTTPGCPPQPCEKVSGLAVSDSSKTTVELIWTAVPGAINYFVQHRKLGSTDWIAGVSVQNLTAISGLDSCTFYEARVLANCGPTSSGPFSDLINFKTTNCTSKTVDFDQSKEAVVFPNPTNNVVNICVNHSFFSIKSIARLYDFTGKKWMENVVEISDKNCVKMDLVELPTGFYQLILMNEKGGFVSKKIVVVR